MLAYELDRLFDAINKAGRSVFALQVTRQLGQHLSNDDEIAQRLSKGAVSGVIMRLVGVVAD